MLLDEAKFAIALDSQARSMTYRKRLKHVALTHQQATLTPASRQDRMVHELLMNRPLPRLQDVYQEIFEDILGQRVSRAGPRLALASKYIDLAKRTGRPILFVLHEQGWIQPSIDSVTSQLIENFVVIQMPLKEAPALSQLTKQPPYESAGRARPLLVVARSDCSQLQSVAGWNPGQLNLALASGWVEALERHPPSHVRKLVRAQHLLKKVDEGFASRVRELTIQVQEEIRESRDSSRSGLTSSGSRRAFENQHLKARKLWLCSRAGIAQRKR